MARYISLLRGINVSGQKKILMKDLRDMYTALGFNDVASYVQSGNVVFSAKKQKEHQLAKKIAAGIAETFGFEVPTLVLDKAYLEEVIKANPFPKKTADDPKMPYVLFLDGKPDNVGLEPPTNETARFIMGEGIIYVYYPDGAGRSKLTTTFFERKLKLSATMRNWKTVAALFEMV